VERKKVTRSCGGFVWRWGTDNGQEWFGIEYPFENGGVLMKTPFLIGRMIFGGFFLYNGINHFRQRNAMQQAAKSKNVPMPDLAVDLTGAAMIAGGTSILLGVKPKLGAAAIAGFLAGVSPIMHNFWKDEQPEQRMNNMINFGKNMALLGGAMTLMAVEEPWPLSAPVAQPSRLKRVLKFARQKVAA
jgi:putative oxidoreductase